MRGSLETGLFIRITAFPYTLNACFSKGVSSNAAQV